MAGLPAARVRGKVLERVRGFGPNVFTQREGCSAGVPQPRPGETVVFTLFLTAGLAPPFSEFLRYALSHYGIHLAHLVPNSIVILSTFAHLCEMFLGIPPIYTSFATSMFSGPTLLIVRLGRASSNGGTTAGSRPTSH